jgi:simple sugar transport system ATP-binding protein
MSHTDSDSKDASKKVASTTQLKSAGAALKLKNITKRFGSLVANQSISLSLGRGEVLALLGENGAGKSTLMSILFGHYTADEGEIEVSGRTLPTGNPKTALVAGIGMVHQHFTLADNLSVLDNVMLGTEALWQVFSRRHAARERLMQVAARFGLRIDPEAKVGSLSVGEKQRVEILKALYRGANILILDEPTSVLTPQESDALFEVLGAMVTQGLSIIFISHKLGEVLRVSHRITVLRAGRLVAEAATKDCTQAQLAQWMVGHAVEVQTRTPAQRVGEVVCELNDVHVAPQSTGRDALKGVTLQLRAGELVAIAGVSGNGQVALAELLSGTRAPSAGRLSLLGQAWRSDPLWLVAQGVARVPEDRHGVGVIGDLPVWENAVSEHLRHRRFSRWDWVRRREALTFGTAVVAAFDVRGSGLTGAARALSGGNMQKLILGRSLSPPSEDAPAKHLIVVHQPTWGLDIGAVQAIQQRLLAARDAGAAVLLLSDDLDEVMAMGDRIAVMHSGQLTEARPSEQWTREQLGLAMAGLEGHEAVQQALQPHEHSR